MEHFAATDGPGVPTYHATAIATYLRIYASKQLYTQINEDLLVQWTCPEMSEVLINSM